MNAATLFTTWMAQAGIGPAELGKRLGVSHQRISALIGGRSTTTRMIVKIGRACGLPDETIGGAVADFALQAEPLSPGCEDRQAEAAP